MEQAAMEQAEMEQAVIELPRGHGTAVSFTHSLTHSLSPPTK